MIDLRTGVPGSGKTLSAIEALAKTIARWEKNPDEARPIFVHGVRDLALPHAVVPLVPWAPSGKAGQVRDVIDWDSMPDGSYVLIDECQSVFPPRGSASEPPPHVAWLNTHRHRGFDITLITQHPKLIDTAARALVGKHQHYRRLFGGQRAAVYEWDACSDSLGGFKNAITSYYAYPKKAFEFYKSAEIHTKQKFKLPRWLMIPVIGLVLGVFAIPFAITRVANLTDPDRLKSSVQAAVKPSSSQTLASVDAGRVGAAAVAPVVAPVTAPAAPASAVVAQVTYAGCMSMGTRCECLTMEGRKAQVEFAQCHADARQLGGNIPYPMLAAAGVGVVPVVAPVVDEPRPSQIGFAGHAGDFRERRQRTIVRGSEYQ